MTIDGEVIETTPWHLFYTDEGWQEVEDLEEGDLVLSLDERYGTVERVTIVAKTQVMYDLTVEEVHTFAVGEGGWVVHNDCNELPIRYTDTWNSGLGVNLQSAVVRAIRATNDNLILGLRTRPPGAHTWDGIVPAKPVEAKNNWKGFCGLRICTIPGVVQPDGTLTKIKGYFVSDLDVAFASLNGRNLSDAEFIDMHLQRPSKFGNRVGNRINQFYGVDIVMHGTHVNGMYARVPGATTSRISDEDIFLFGAGGYLDSGPGDVLYRMFAPSAPSLPFIPG